MNPEISLGKSSISVEERFTEGKAKDSLRQINLNLALKLEFNYIRDNSPVGKFLGGGFPFLIQYSRSNSKYLSSTVYNLLNFFPISFPDGNFKGYALLNNQPCMNRLQQSPYERYDRRQSSYQNRR